MKTLLRVLALAGFTFVSHGQTKAARVGSIQMVVVDPEGNPLPYRFVELRSTDAKRSSFLNHCERLRCLDLPFGLYQYVVVRRNVASPTRPSDIAGKFVVRLPESHLTLTPHGVFEQLPDGSEAVIDYGPPLGEMSGRVVGMANGTDSWIRFFNPFTELSFEIPIHKDGTFRILEPPPFGVYVVVVIAKEKILCTQIIRFKDPPDKDPFLVYVRPDRK